MAPKPFNMRNKGKTDRGQSSNPAPKQQANAGNQKSKAVEASIEPQICFTCHKKGDKKEMAKCSTCGEWFHPACENEEPRAWEDDPKFEFWNCEKCQSTIDARDDNNKDDNEDEDNDP
ncbi:PHD-finger [Carex littledalei]|uniref:PHD-finger n=1 Tax=Carex littledalei TaxID=544730 RepID=A0A833VBZ8_9POAL|nr:PHD-finger [Carex littledalei]